MIREEQPKEGRRVRGKQAPTTEIQPSTSSSSTARGILASGAKAGVESFAKVGAIMLLLVRFFDIIDDCLFEAQQLRQK